MAMSEEERKLRRKEVTARYRKKHHSEVLQRTRIWREKNIEKAREATRKWYHSDRGQEMTRNRPIDKEKISAKNRKSYERLSQDPEYRAKKNEYSKRWQKENPDKVLARYQRRRARKMGAGDFSLTSVQWEEIKRNQSGKCWYCGIETKLEQEHQIPLSRGGMHSVDNVVGSCRPCNRTKHTLTAEEFLIKKGLSSWPQ